MRACRSRTRSYGFIGCAARYLRNGTERPMYLELDGLPMGQATCFFVRARYARAIGWQHGVMCGEPVALLRKRLRSGRV
jgi:hypothetical protein